MASDDIKEGRIMTEDEKQREYDDWLSELTKERLIIVIKHRDEQLKNREYYIKQLEAYIDAKEKQ